MHCLWHQYTVNTVHQKIEFTSLWYCIHTLRSNSQDFTIQTTTVCCHTTYCDVVLIACHKTSQFILCDTGSGDVQKSSIWGQGSIGVNVDEVKLSTVSTTQHPAHIDIHSSISIFSEVNTREGGDRGWTWNYIRVLIFKIVLVPAGNICWLLN